MKRKILLNIFIYIIWCVFIIIVVCERVNCFYEFLVNLTVFTVLGVYLPFLFLKKTSFFKVICLKLRGQYYASKMSLCGKNLHVGEHVNIFHPERISIGNNCDIADNVVFAPLCEHRGIEYPSKITVGNNVHFGTNDRIASKEEVIIEDDVLFAAFVHVTDHSHDYHDVNLPISRQGVIGKGKVIIKRGAWLAFGCHVLSGVTIGENSVVAANSVVTKDVPAYSVVAGNPAKVVKTYNFAKQKWESVK